MIPTWSPLDFPKRTQKHQQINPKTNQIFSCFSDRVWNPNRSKNNAKIDQKSSLCWGGRLGGVRHESLCCHHRCFVLARATGLLAHVCTSKIDTTIEQCFDAFRDRIFGGFWSILGTKMEPCWHQKLIQKRSYLKNASKPTNKIKPIEFQWICGLGGHKLGAKIHQKSIKKWSRTWTASWHRFCGRLWWILRPN